MSEWIEWTGSDCPVDGDTLVCMKFTGETSENSGDAWSDVYSAKYVWWDSVIAYRIVKEQSK